MNDNQLILDEFIQEGKLNMNFPLTFMFLEKCEEIEKADLMFRSYNHIYKSNSYFLVDLYKPVSSIIYENN